MVAVGVMSVPWMLVLALVALVEKTWTRGALIGRIVGVAMIAYGAVFFVFPSAAPAGLAVQGSTPGVMSVHQHHGN